MLSKTSFYIDDKGGAYIIGKTTDKTVLFVPVKSEFVGLGEVSSAFLYDVIRRATREPDESRKPIRFKLCNNFSTQGTVVFYERKNGLLVGMYETESDTYTVERNHG